MHIAVSWDITDGPDRSELNERMVAVLNPYSWIRPLTTFYIIQTDVYGRQAIQDGLISVGRMYPSRVHFLVSPLMSGGYQGFLPNNLWAQINERTK